MVEENNTHARQKDNSDLIKIIGLTALGLGIVLASSIAFGYYINSKFGSGDSFDYKYTSTPQNENIPQSNK